VAAAVLIAALAAAAFPSGRIASVAIDAPGARDPASMRQELGLREGDPFSRSELRCAVQALIASREFEDVVATAETTPAGIVLTLRLQVACRVSRITIEGMSRRSKRLLRGAIKAVPGGVLDVPALESAVAGTERRLQADGYPAARLEISLDFDVPAATVAITIAGSLGPHQRIATVSAPGIDLKPGTLYDACGLEPGDKVRTQKIDRARRALEAYLRREGWWEARVAAPQLTGSAQGAAVSLETIPGPRYRLELTGIERSRALDSEAMPFLRGGEPFAGDAAETAEAVRRFLQRKRYLLASVSGTLGDADGVSLLRIAARPGPRKQIKEVRFPGAVDPSPVTLRERVGAKKKGFVPWGRESVDDGTLASDASSVLALLRRAGLAEAKVGTPLLSEAMGGFVIDFPVSEGTRYAVASLRVEGLPAGVRQPKLPLPIGGPWSEVAEQDACDAIGAALHDAAYLDAEVDSTRDCRSGRCDVVITATAGERTVLDRLVVAGLARTHRGVADKLADLDNGAPLGAAKLLEAQRRLLRLGIFEQATLNPVPNQVASAPQAYLLDLQEAPTRALAYGVEWDSVDQTRLSFSWSQLSLLGSGRSLSFTADVSHNDQDYELLYREPLNLGVLGIPTWMSLYHTDENRNDYTVRRRGTWIEVGDRWRKPVRLIPRFEYSLVGSDAPPEDQSELEREDQNVKIASVTPILEWDTRDDQLSPRRGAYLSLQPQFAFPAGKADAEFNKVTLLLSGYQPAGHSVVAGSLRVGGINPKTADTAETPTPDNLRLPIAVRYFAGGRISNRAFPTDHLGAEGTFDSEGRPIGGAGMLLANLELRFAVAGRVGGSLFVDGGNVWPSWRDISIPGMRWGAGLGVRVETPAGPFRVEYGWKLDRLPGESGGELFFSFGNPF
jgi:outer membrane protein insertion porin family